MKLDARTELPRVKTYKTMQASLEQLMGAGSLNNYGMIFQLVPLYSKSD